MPTHSTSCGDLVAGAPAQIKLRAPVQPSPIPSTCDDGGCCSACSSAMSKGHISPSDARVDLAIEPVPHYALHYSNSVQENCSASSVDFGNGTNWTVGISPKLVLYDDDSVAIWFSPSEGYWFDESLVTQFGAKVSLAPGGSDDYKLTMPDGTVYLFHDYNQSSYPKGSLKSYTDPGGTVSTAVSYYDDALIEELQRSFDVPADFGSEDSVIESLFMTYGPTGAGGADQVQTVTARRKVNGGPWAPYARASMAYWADGEKGGQEGNLKRVDMEVPAGTGWAVTGSYYFRYGTSGASGLLKFWLSPESTRRLSEDPGVDNIDTAPEETVREYADNEFGFDEAQRVTSSSWDNGEKTVTVAYTTSVHADSYNNWKTKAVLTMPDGSLLIMYLSYLQQKLLIDQADGSDHWIKNWVYGESSPSTWLLTQMAHPSAVASYTEGSADLGVSLNSGAGLIEVYSYLASPLGYLQHKQIKEGSSGTLIKQMTYAYTSRTPAGGHTIYLVSTPTVYRDDAGTQAIVTTLAYTYFTDLHQVSQVETTLPVISAGQNGDGATYTTLQRFDIFGNPTWFQDQLGFISLSQPDQTLAGIRRPSPKRLQPAGGGAPVLVSIRDVAMALMVGWPGNPGWSTPGGGGRHLRSDRVLDRVGRTTLALGPVHDVDGQGVRRAQMMVYKDAEHEAYNGRGYAAPAADGKGYLFTLVNPVSISKRNYNGKNIEQIQAIRAETDGPLTARDSFAQPDYVRWSTTQYDNAGDMVSARQYTTIPSSGEGTAGTNYLETAFAYDSMDRRNRTLRPTGTIARTVYDVRSHVTESWLGTDDTGATDADPSGGGAAGNNMVLTVENQYDGGNDGGDGNLTQKTEHVDGDAANDRVTAFIYDFRSRQTAIDGEMDFYQVNTYDNLNQVTQVDRKDTTSGGNLVARSQTSFDDLQRAYKRVQVAVDPSTGTTGNNRVLENTWRDGKGQVIASTNGNAAPVRKTAYDGAGRSTRLTVGYESGGNDYILDQLDMIYDPASNVVSRSLLQRYHDDTTTTGPLTAATDARPQYSASWFDGIGRQVASANYGTNGGAAFSRPDSVPARSDDVLVSETRYNDKGEAFESLDPMERVTHRDFDDAGRAIRTIENYLPGSSATDANVIVEQGYNESGQLATVTALNPDTGNQVTSYLWGVSAPKSDLYSNDLLREMRFPGGKLDVTSQAYNRQSQVKEWTDQNGTVHGYSFDKLGRMLFDELLATGLNVDTAITKIGLTYEVRGLVENITSYDSTPTVKNQVVNEYNTLGLPTYQYQEHDGAKDGSTPFIWHDYDSSNAAGEFTKDQRLIRRDWPNGDRLYFNYGAAAGAGDLMSRVDNLASSDTGGTQYANYQYLGMGTFVIVAYPEIDTTFVMTLDHGTANAYAGLDRFNRIVDMLWDFHSLNIDRFKYGYDRNSNPLFAYNNVHTDFGNEYAYDQLNRLIDAKRGTINSGTGVVADPDHREAYDLDTTGNWNGYFVEEDGVTTLKQRRAFNEVNEITDLTNWVVPEYDLAGNMTTIPQPADPKAAYALTWDGWNRLVKVVEGTTTIAEYAYDGLMRRQTVDDQTDVRHFYYSLQWQVVEERLNALTTMDKQYVWGIRYIDDLVRRKTASGSPTVIYALKDRMWSISTLYAGESVLQRFIYDPYGKPIVLDDSFSPTTDAYEWEYRFQGRRWDSDTELYQFRMRSYDSMLGLFLSRDTLGFVRYMANVNSALNSNPINVLDPLGLLAILEIAVIMEAVVTAPAWLPVATAAAVAAVVVAAPFIAVYDDEQRRQRANRPPPTIGPPPRLPGPNLPPPVSPFRPPTVTPYPYPGTAPSPDPLMLPEVSPFPTPPPLPEPVPDPFEDEDKPRASTASSEFILDLEEQWCCVVKALGYTAHCYTYWDTSVFSANDRCNVLALLFRIDVYGGEKIGESVTYDLGLTPCPEQCKGKTKNVG